ncbi:MAG: S1 family peptidase [bacterium]
MDPIDLIAQVRSGVAQLSLERGRTPIGRGSGFLVEQGLLTNSHNIRGQPIDAVAVRFADTDPDDPDSYTRLVPDDCLVAESPEGQRDYACLRLEPSEFDDRHVFEFSSSSDPLSVGEQVLFLGFPFGMPQMTAHIGYVSSLHTSDGIDIIQLDGSVNGGNSGGPLLDLETGTVGGIITKAVTGLIERQFNQLMAALRRNREACEQASSVITIGAIDPIQAIGASQAAMERIARDLHRSANVGIGYAYSARYARDALAGTLK